LLHTTLGIKRDSTIIKGKVVDEQGNPIVAATIMIKGTHVGTLSDGEGIFKLRQKQITNDLTLVFSSVGYEMAERKIQKNEYSDDLKVQLVVLKMAMQGSSL